MSCPICNDTGTQSRTVWEPTGNKTAEGKVERKKQEQTVPCAYCRLEEFYKWAKQK